VARYSKLGRSSAQRRALLRSLVTALFREEKIRTTEARAREVSSIAEKLITRAREGGLAARRDVYAYLLDDDVARKVCDTISARYAHQEGGYTRMVRIGPRQGDGAPMVILELV